MDKSSNIFIISIMIFMVFISVFALIKSAPSSLMITEPNVESVNGDSFLSFSGNSGEEFIPFDKIERVKTSDKDFSYYQVYKGDYTIYLTTEDKKRFLENYEVEEGKLVLTD